MVPPPPTGLSLAPSRWCGTRALKNARALLHLLPREFKAPGAGGSLLDLLPLEELVRLHLLTPAELDAVDSRLGRLRGPIPGPGALRGPLFTGTLRFLAVAYDVGSSSPVTVAPADLATAMQYAGQALVPTLRYVGQYGSVQGQVASAPVPSRFANPNGQISDADLQSWIDALFHAGTLAPGDCPVVLAPPRVLNTDAPASKGVLGYHGHSQLPYIFVNVLGAGFTLADPQDVYALALSHEIAEMLVDPAADGSNPEVCDPCGPNCQNALRDYFSGNGQYLGTTTAFPPAYSYGFYLNAIVQPSASAACPAPVRACAYGPP
ncbi:MAG TPA: hypothetical protein VEY07_00580 [Thermoplasmata archaeon]|nr:hypothetical protein [Thermoplasmata archaeon]